MTADLKVLYPQDPDNTIRLLQQELNETNHEVLLLNLELEKRVDERTAELRATQAELQRTNSELLQLTFDLKAANKDLEAFSYSVSHDLRSPLRAIDGFARILLEDFAPQMPQEARRLVDTVSASARQMRQMIDDLLQFSRLGRQRLSRSQVSMSNLVSVVLNELRPEQADRHIQIQIRDLPDCIADPSLLKHVLVNLLSNALKFTQHKPIAVIEVGSTQENGKTVYFVRDNGAGFDMQFADKLFGVFQRLHDQQEFEGTGVGLSIVQRIIERHGGRIWAEGEVDKGATFYFTIPNK